jgi:hypothetical protein
MGRQIEGCRELLQRWHLTRPEEISRLKAEDRGHGGCRGLEQEPRQQQEATPG